MNDRQRLVLAVLLILLIWFVPMLIWPSKRPAVGRLGGSADSSVVRDSSARAPTPGQPVSAAPPRAQPPTRPTADTGRVVGASTPPLRPGLYTRRSVHCPPKL